MRASIVIPLAFAALFSTVTAAPNALRGGPYEITVRLSSPEPTHALHGNAAQARGHTTIATQYANDDEYKKAMKEWKAKDDEAKARINNYKKAMAEKQEEEKAMQHWEAEYDEWRATFDMPLDADDEERYKKNWIKWRLRDAEAEAWKHKAENAKASEKEFEDAMKEWEARYDAKHPTSTRQYGQDQEMPSATPSENGESYTTGGVTPIYEASYTTPPAITPTYDQQRHFDTTVVVTSTTVVVSTRTSSHHHTLAPISPPPTIYVAPTTIYETRTFTYSYQEDNTERVGTTTMVHDWKIKIPATPSVVATTLITESVKETKPTPTDTAPTRYDGPFEPKSS
jgi:hypothetical protein